MEDKWDPEIYVTVPDYRGELVTINHTLRVGVDQAIHRSLRMTDLFRQRLLAIGTSRCGQSSLILLPQ